MIVVENPDTVKHIRNLEAAIQRVRELADELATNGLFHLQDIAQDIYRALDGEQ